MPGTCARLRPGSLHCETAPLDQRLARRFPRLVAFVRTGIFRLPPTSRLRQAFAKRVLRLAFSSYERGDIAGPIDLFYSPAVEMRGGELGDIGPDMEYDVRGKDGVRRWIEQWQDSFAWVRHEVTELLDFGRAFVFSLHQVAEGRASGAPTELTSHSAVRFEGGLVIWQAWYRDRDEALRAIGVDPAGIVRPD